MTDRVREPIQTYLSATERSELDRVARELGVSRSEALRRGIRALGQGVALSPALRELAAAGLVTPPMAGPGDPPPSYPVALLEELLSELSRDRADR